MLPTVFSLVRSQLKNNEMKRNEFIKHGLLGLPGFHFLPAIGTPVSPKQIKSIDVETIKEFVIAGHNDLDKVKEMLSNEPNLIYSRHDWGDGDFEEAIEGAGHIGNKEIANYLIEQGARVNLFILTMLGKNNIVIPALEEYPSLITAKGPHGFTLLHHAKIGGEESKEIYNYLIGKRLNETQFQIN
jgi:hypothetical protein